ncbi:hypothetical protein AQUCO_01400868v1 [Aquilegia coerulea]|uniref:Uncharacterized protein n=1 Tax=Aquilegia coerulea TaxID=218851 RepID=A0A2G5DYI3_AQUCA|nr:hypothetical protein AQUCO_01400868v1 [Aquilegia coerulea]
MSLYMEKMQALSAGKKSSGLSGHKIECIFSKTYCSCSSSNKKDSYDTAPFFQARNPIEGSFCIVKTGF